MSTHATCAICGRGIEFVVYDDPFGNTHDAWWAHTTPAHTGTAGHDATPLKVQP